MTETSDFRPLLLDLFCGAGGAAMGYHRAGFDVTGVDTKPQPHYPFTFVQADAMTFPLDGFDAIHASPPCQDHMKTPTHNQAAHGTGWMLAATRERLAASGAPWVIENVPGAPLRPDYELCGCMFPELRTRSKRWFETSWRAFGLVPGIGSHVSWDARLDGRLGQAIMSIQAMKGVSVGNGFEVAGKGGSQAHDEIFWSEERGYFRETNRAGGLEGGMTTGEPLVVRGAMKPLPTLTKPLRSVDTETHAPAAALRERTDSCTVPAAGVVGEAMVALVLADAYRQKFAGDHIDDVKAALRAYEERISWIPRRWD